MADITSCPGGSQWQQFLEGQLPPLEGEFLAKHLPECPTCLAVVTTLEDEQGRTLAPGILFGTEGPESALLERLVNQVCRLGSLNKMEATPGRQGGQSPYSPASPFDWAETETLPPADPAQEWATLPTVSLPGYEILGELGRGGMGVVYKARQEKAKRIVALKVTLTGSYAGFRELARFHTEAEAAARLQHPHIVQVFEVGEHQGQPFFSLEYCPGGSLARKLAKGPLSPREAAALVEGLARATHHAHQHGIIHRDLKPANVLLSEDGTPKIADFGLAKKVEEAGTTVTGTVMGTPSYMAPEQAKGRTGQIGPASDIYALGAILYEGLTGRPPFLGATTLDTLFQVIGEEPVPPTRLNKLVPKDLQTICLKCLEKDPGRRYGSAAELADDLRRFQDGDPIRARPPSFAGRVMRWARLRPDWAATLAALAVFYGAHLVLLALGYQREPVQPALGLPQQGDVFHLYVTGLVVCWAVGAGVFQKLSLKSRWHTWAIYGWASMEILLFTALLGVADGPRSPLAIGYLLLIAGNALRFRVGLILFVTGLSVVSYVGLSIDAYWHRPSCAVPGNTMTLFAVSLVLLGLIMYLLLRQVRATISREGCE